MESNFQRIFLAMKCSRDSEFVVQEFFVLSTSKMLFLSLMSGLLAKIPLLLAVSYSGEVCELRNLGYWFPCAI